MDNKSAAKTEQKPGAATKHQRPRRKKMLAPLVAILALVLAANSFYLTWSLYQQSTYYASSILVLKEQQSATIKQLREALQGWSASEQKMKSQVSELSKNLHTALQQRLYQNQDWIMLKARHYLELAQINWHWSRDSRASIALLQQADSLLRELSDQRIFPVRQSLATEISRLQSIPDVDIAGLLSQLDAAQATVSTLPIQTIIISPLPNGATPAETSSPSAWRAKLRENISMLEKLVIIKRNDEDIKPMLTPLHQAVLRESIRMNLQEAQWAILQSNTLVYQHSLSQALDDIARTFDNKAPGTQALIKTLQNLQQQNLSPEKPAITESLRLLNQIIDASTTGDKTP